MKTRNRLLAASLAVAIAAAGSTGAMAAPPVPLDITAASGPAAPAIPAKTNPCRIHIAALNDLRSDKTTMGYMSFGMVTSSDGPGWIRSGLKGLDGDARFALVDSPEKAEVVMNVELLKSYVLAVNMTKAATVVFRVRYNGGERSLGDNLYRGTKDAVNWAGTKSETLGAMNLALVEAVNQTKADLVKACAAVRGG
ncbi:MAG TPA: hypothetical protein VEA44_06500 [Caulobacter sp.]|nr:hypothetical protein [Caulobacter sp.]